VIITATRTSYQQAQEKPRQAISNGIAKEYFRILGQKQELEMFKPHPAAVMQAVPETPRINAVIPESHLYPVYGNIP